MDIESLSIDHQLCKSWEIILNFPVDLVSGKGINRGSHLRLDDDHHRFSEFVLNAVYHSADQSRIQDPGGIAVDFVQIELMLRSKPCVVENAGISTGNKLLAIDCDSDHGTQGLCRIPLV